MRFELSLCGGALAESHRRRVGDLERALPWSSLAGSHLEPDVRAAASRRWTEMAFNEHRSSILMAQLVQALGEAQVPLDLHSIACSFPLQELSHAEICGRVVSHLGGAADLETATLETTFALPAGLTPAERCNEVVVRFCCVSETISKRWLAHMRARVAHPLVHAVLSRILRDEAHHRAFGWLYLDWCLDEGLLDDHERKRLTTIAAEALESCTSFPEAGDPAAGREAPDILVSLSAPEMRQLMARAAAEVRSGFERRGLAWASAGRQEDAVGEPTR
ncbi:MAG TPA: hypothetical protein VEQ10_21525 [Vicinamibacteria bacterium]|nr:hypothetical protein [Vicinamibacteria bacterium]